MITVQVSDYICRAASALNLEYTLPDNTERDITEEWKALQVAVKNSVFCSTSKPLMVVFLSTSMLEELGKD